MDNDLIRHRPFKMACYFLNIEHILKISNNFYSALYSRNPKCHNHRSIPGLLLYQTNQTDILGPGQIKETYFSNNTIHRFGIDLELFFFLGS